MARREEAMRIFKSGYNCSQAVVGVFCEEFGLDKETALKISTAFGGGCRNGEVCGAVSGALMALGLKEGHHVEGDVDTKDKAYSLTKEFINRFKEKYDTIICKELLGHDLSIEGQKEIIKEKGLFDTLCPKLVMDAVETIEDMFELGDTEESGINKDTVCHK
ncbi:C-GCAxxG-C-C family protein [Wukongibacter baidiensis]|uniref:C-GCAxxG-C-C family protein n=1 Tax=Wukongibacter baidiensis TaxID=1723361 RepID=UPI003D7F6F13